MTCVRRRAIAAAIVAATLAVTVAGCSSTPSPSNMSHAGTKTNRAEPKKVASVPTCTSGAVPVGTVQTVQYDGAPLSVQGGSCFDTAQSVDGVSVSTMTTFLSQVCDEIGAATDLNRILGHGVLEVVPYVLGQGGSCVYLYSATKLAQLGDISSLTNTLGDIVGVDISVQYQSGGADAQWTASIGTQDVKVTPLPQLAARAVAVATNDGSQYYEAIQDNDGATVHVAAGIPTSQAGVLDQLKPLIRNWLLKAITAGHQYLSAANGPLDSGRTLPPPSGITDADVQKLMTECPGMAALGGQDWADLSLTSPQEGTYIMELAQKGDCSEDIQQWPGEAGMLN